MKKTRITPIREQIKWKITLYVEGIRLTPVENQVREKVWREMRDKVHHPVIDVGIDISLQCCELVSIGIVDMGGEEI